MEPDFSGSLWYGRRQRTQVEIQATLVRQEELFFFYPWAWSKNQKQTTTNGKISTDQEAMDIPTLGENLYPYLYAVLKQKWRSRNSAVEQILMRFA